MKQIDIERASNEAILGAIGDALATRIDQKPGTRKDFSKKAGVGRTSLYRLINGENTNMETFIRVLRTLGMKDVLYALTKEAIPSPMQSLVKKQIKAAKRGGRHLTSSMTEKVGVSDRPTATSRLELAKPKGGDKNG